MKTPRRSISININISDAVLESVVMIKYLMGWGVFISSVLFIFLSVFVEIKRLRSCRVCVGVVKTPKRRILA